MPTANSKKQNLPQRLTLSAAISAALLVGYGGRSAYAGTCTETGGVASGIWTCVDPAGADVPQNLTPAPGGMLSVTTDSGFGITTAFPTNAFYMINVATDTDITFTDNEESTITGGFYGIRARNNGTGSTTITSTGTIIGGSSDGINARTSSNTTDLSVTTFETEGVRSGIAARNFGSGSNTVTSTGKSTGTNRYGIYASARVGSTYLSVTAVDTTGGLHGLYALNNGTSFTTVTSMGSAIGISGDGIRAANRSYGNGTYLIVNATDAAGGQAGINARNDENGSTSVTVTGVITGTTNDGIKAYNTAAGTSLAVTIGTGKVSGGDDGIEARNYGTGATMITTMGMTTGTNADGIYTYNAATTSSITFDLGGDVLGGIDGLDARHYGAGILDITTSTTFTGTTGDGIATRTDSVGSGNVGTSNITSNAGANVSGGTNAIFNDAGASNTTINTGAVVTGNIVLGDGSDNLSFVSSDFNTITVFDGGDDVDVTDGFIDTLTFTNSSGALIGANVRNWENVVIDTGSTISFSDNMLTAGTLTTNAGGILDSAGGTLNFTGDLINSNLVTMQDGDTADTTTVTGNYTGGGTLDIDTELGDETSPSDVLIVTGDTSGTTTLNINNLTGLGATTAGDGILVVQVDGVSDGIFILGGELRAGDFLYDLVQVNGNWYLQSMKITPIPTLSQWSQVLLASLLVGLALLGFKRRRN